MTPKDHPAEMMSFLFSKIGNFVIIAPISVESVLVIVDGKQQISAPPLLPRWKKNFMERGSEYYFRYLK